jgi:hypothetical protein
MAVEPIAVVLAVVAAGAELTAPEALVLAADNGVPIARRARLRHDGLDGTGLRGPCGRLSNRPGDKRRSSENNSDRA